MRLLMTLLLTALIIPKLAFSQPAVPPAAPTGVCSAIVYDLDHDAILFEQNADERIPPASLTKVMSMFLALNHIQEGLANFNDAVIISPSAAGTGGSRMGIRTAETVKLNKLLMGMAVSSGNDASHAVAEHIGGSASSFVRMMNAKAKQLGMNDSNFENPHGLPAPGQFTTARDMLTLGRAYLKAHPYAMRFHNTRILEHNGYKSWNKNPLLGQYPGADGLKTGWIRASGYNMIFTAERNGRRLLAVIMGAPDTYMRSAEACRLLDAGFMVCENSAVSIAAALDAIPLDINRIDPRKTARDYGIGYKRAIAKNGQKSGKLSRQARLLAQKQITKNPRLAMQKNFRVNKLSIKNGRITAQKPATPKNANKHKVHAEKKSVKAKRG